MQFPKSILILMAAMTAALAVGCDVDEPSSASSVVVRAAAVEGSHASHLVEIDQQLRQVDRYEHEREVVVLVAEPSGEVLAAAVEHAGGIDYFDAELARVPEAPEDAATQTLLELAIDDALPLPGTPLPSFRRWHDPGDQEDTCQICSTTDGYWFCQNC
jgi:hypothetical protein